MQNLGINLLGNPIIWERILIGLTMNLKTAMFALIFIILFGFILGILRINMGKTFQIIFKIYLDIVRVTPILVLLYLLYYIVPRIFNLHIENTITGIIVFSFWGIAEMSDIVRQAIISLPKHQYESAFALGLTKTQVYLYIIIPQSLTSIIPASLNLFARIIMTTSLLVLIGIRDVIKVGKEIIEFYAFTDKNAPFWIYGVILLIFFIICYSLTKLSEKLDHRIKKS